MEYYCHYCHDWLDSLYCLMHFESVHGQKDVTFEKLKKRMETFGGLETREEPPTVVEEETPKPKNWMFRDKNDNVENGMFITSNFQNPIK